MEEVFYELILIFPVVEERRFENELRSLRDHLKEKSLSIVREYDFGVRDLVYRFRDDISQQWVHKGAYRCLLLSKDYEFDFNLQTALKWYYRTGDFKPLKFEVKVIKKNQIEGWLKGLDGIQSQRFEQKDNS